ncbi:MAG: glutaminase [Pseudomonadota bacterium]
MTRVPHLQALAERVFARLAPRRGEGSVARYIPALAAIDPARFALAIAHVDGRTGMAGDHDIAFSIQSVSKVFTLALALEKAGVEVWSRVGSEPSGTPFNSIVQLEKEHGIPRNPFINAGAIAVTDLLLASEGPDTAIAAILTFLQRASASTGPFIDQEIAASEAATGSRNASLAHFMKSFGTLSCAVDDALNVYFHQCAASMTCGELARAGLFLANKGVDPLTGERLVSEQTCHTILSLMLTCGHYDASGDFALRVGMPGKSGVGGGILAIMPGVASIAVWSPGLNANGNSLVGTLALEALAQETGWSIFR